VGESIEGEMGAVVGGGTPEVAAIMESNFSRSRCERQRSW
jgi:hypothetical protein